MNPDYNPDVEVNEARAYPPYSTQPLPADDIRPVIEGTTPQHHAARNFTQSWGLHPGVALLVIVLDTMLFGGQLATLETIYPLVIAVSVGLGVVTFMAQKKFYGDDNEAAFIKAFVCFGLTVIPTSLPGFLTIPAGVIGLFRKER